MSHLEISKVVDGKRKILPGKDLADLIFTFVIGRFLSSKGYALTTDRDDLSKYVLSLTNPTLSEVKQAELANRYVEIPRYRRDGDNSYWITFFLKKEATEGGDNLDQTSMYYNTVMPWDKPDQLHWDWEEAAEHIWKYLTEQIIDGDRFPDPIPF